MWKKIVPVSLVLIAVLPFTACGEAAEEEAGLPSTQEIIDGVIEAQDDIRTYEFEMDMTMNMAGEVEGEAGEVTMSMTFNGAIDLDNRKMRTDMDMSMVATGEDEMAMEMEMAMAIYLIGDMGYIMMDVPDAEPTWMKEEVSEADWEQIAEGMAITEPQIDLLGAAQVEVIGSEKVKGVDCYVLQLTPDMEQLWQLVMQQAAFGGQGILFPAVAEESLQEMFRSFSVKQWIAKDTYFLTKVEIDMAVDLTAEAMEVEEGQIAMDFTISLLAYNYNQPVSIVVPPEAEEATESLTNAEDEARRTEYRNMQSAVTALMVDNGVPYLPNPIDYAGGTATNDMTAFPDSTTTAADKGYTGVGTPKAGYVLYAHALIGADTATFNTVNYVTMAKTTYYYTCEADSTVHQFDGPDVATATEYEY